MKKKKDEITIRSSAAEYLTYIASIGDQQDSIEMRYEDENIWLTQKMIPVRGSGNYESDEAKEIARLKRELRDAQDALDMLKKAIGILGKD